MKKIIYWPLSIAFCLLVMSIAISCSKSDDDTAAAEEEAKRNEQETKLSKKEIITFSFTSLNPPIVGIIDADLKTITATVPNGTDVRKLTPTILISDKASVSPASKEVRDFSIPCTYTVTAADGTTQDYVVTVIESTKTDYTVSSDYERTTHQGYIFQVNFDTQKMQPDADNRMIFTQGNRRDTLSIQPQHIVNRKLIVSIPLDLPLGDYQIKVIYNNQWMYLPYAVTVLPPLPKIEAVSPTTVSAGSQVVITGQYFQSTGNTVLFHKNSTPLTPDAESATSITVTIPSGIIPGKYTLTVVSNGKNDFCEITVI